MIKKYYPKLAYRHVGYLSNTALNPQHGYIMGIDCHWAQNQPDWQKRGLIFFECPNGAPALSLDRTEYSVVVHDSIDDRCTR